MCVKWSGLALGLLCVGAWIASIRATCGWWGPGGELLSVRPGVLTFARGVTTLKDVQEPGWFWRTSPNLQLPEWLIDWTPGFAAVSLPLWMPALLASGIGALAWLLEYRAKRKERARSCRLCGYDRRGLEPQAPCPECGQPATRRVLVRNWTVCSPYAVPRSGRGHR